jgi:hypothetical protein
MKVAAAFFVGLLFLPIACVLFGVGIILELGETVLERYGPYWIDKEK